MFYAFPIHVGPHSPSYLLILFYSVIFLWFFIFNILLQLILPHYSHLILLSFLFHLPLVCRERRTVFSENVSLGTRDTISWHDCTPLVATHSEWLHTMTLAQGTVLNTQRHVLYTHRQFLVFIKPLFNQDRLIEIENLFSKRVLSKIDGSKSLYKVARIQYNNTDIIKKQEQLNSQ